MPINEVDFDTLPADNTLLSLGKVLARASQAEHLLRLLIKDLSGKTYGDGMMKTHKNSNLGSLKDCLCNMVGTGQYSRIKKLDDSALKELRKIISDSIVLADLRNTICHTCWAVGAKKVPEKTLSDFHKRSASLMTAIEIFRRPRFHNKNGVAIASWRA